MSRRIPGTAQAMNLYPDYFTFTFLRNPYERFVSLWLDLRRVARERRGGAVEVKCDRPVAALGLPLHGGDFAALEAVAIPAPEEADPEEGGDGKRFREVLPLVLDGAGFRSDLIVTNLSETANRCTMHFNGEIHAARFPSAAGVTRDGFYRAMLELAGDGGQVRLSSYGWHSLAIGYAALDCDAPVAARNLLTAGTADGPGGIAALAPVHLAREVRFPVAPRMGSLALTLTNDAVSGASCRATLALPGERTLASGSPITVEGKSTAVRFLADLFELPYDFSGGTVDLLCDRETAAVALPVAGAAFAALPPIVPVFEITADAADAE